MSKTPIPPMPQDAVWTADQWRAIWAKNQDILVAAAAGSGKTAVLVNRIIEKILDANDPLNVDELLVVTFTNASAAEMKHRISDALEQAIRKNPESQHLRKQLSLINRASISTLHSFCLEVIRTYYYLTDIDPGFRIADSAEAELLRDEVMEELFEEQYGEETNEAFFRLVDAYTSDRSDEALQDMIRALHTFSMSHPDPSGWLDSAAEMYEIGEEAAIEDLPFAEPLFFDIKLSLQSARDYLHQALDLAKAPGGPAPRAENYLADLSIIDRLEKASEGSWNALYEEMQGDISFSRAKTCRGSEYDKDLIKQADDCRKKAKKAIEELKTNYFSRTPVHYLEDMREMKGLILTLTGLVKQFESRFRRAKAEKNLVDFSDLEHYCLEILSDTGADGQKKPSEAAEVYRRQFREVLIDEYQDTNLVQESILALVSQDGEHSGNLFMVGDVKQSIYKFRLAEPNLFLGKYSRFTSEGRDGGLRIDLNKNFRSRKEILSGTNFLFRQLMGTEVGEIDYDRDAELKLGAPYPEDRPYPVELHLVESSPEQAESDEQSGAEGFEEEELEKAQAEARLMAGLIKEAIREKQQIYDTKTGLYRSVTYRDMVILLRSMPWASQIMEEFKKQGIPVYASLSTGYFEANEVRIMLSLLQVIDNPQQDIPLVSVLRSPIVGMDEEELAKIRLFHTGGYYEALADFVRLSDPAADRALYDKAARFYKSLNDWRNASRTSSLSDLIWELYRETGFYDFAGGMPGGKQRQSNLRALYDRARQYEKSSFRGLFRFLRFIERMQERGDDLGAAKSIGEQEDVVRLMTIHSSKGLEFPVVFVAGLGRQFNLMDIRKSYLLDKEYGFASKYVDPVLRITYPSLPQMAFKKKQQLEAVSEEMRVLYVALTRAKEKLHLIGTVKEAGKSLAKWTAEASGREQLLKNHVRAGALSYLDWIGPALVRHRDSEALLLEKGVPAPSGCLEDDSSWKLAVVPPEALRLSEDEEERGTDWLEMVKRGEKPAAQSEFRELITDRLSWEYSGHDASVHRSKQSVSELKRQNEVRDETSGTDLLRRFKRPITARPAFMQEKSLTAAEKGTITHLVMQHIDLTQEVTVQSLSRLLEDMLARELMTEEQLAAVDKDVIVSFFETQIGQRLRGAKEVRREVPFMMAVSAAEAYADWKRGEEEVLVQGVIDCLFEDEAGLVLLDYKTDAITGRFHSGFEGARDILAERYRIQLTLYARAAEQILGKKVTKRCLFFFDDGGRLIELED